MNLRNASIRPTVLAILVPAVAILGALQFGCSTVKSWGTSPTSMTSASDVPASEGTVKATAGDNGNTRLAIRVKHLAPAYKVQTDATVYVVWLQQPNQPLQNIGALTLSDSLVGSLDTESPYRRFTISITPEPGQQGQQPTHPPVFTADVNRHE
jgi:hypothetical protein